MIRSMTGYGEAERETPAGRLRAEVRTVNHRFFSANLKLTRAADRFEPRIRDELRTFMPRGHVNFTLRLETENGAGDSASVVVDEARARSYFEALSSLKTMFGLSGDIDVATLLRFGDIVGPADLEDVEPLDVDDVVAVTADAARAAVDMREAEGVRLAEDMEERLRAVEAALAGVERRAPERMVAERDRLRRVVADLLADTTAQVDEDRIAREIAHLAERWDISEEVVRLSSHIEMFRRTLGLDASEPVGKRLSFLVQEMNRETNTIGAKSNDAPMEHHVVAIKDEVERLREQIENVE
jgi:uncharacterized protein (TIGR00255 family)